MSQFVNLTFDVESVPESPSRSNNQTRSFIRLATFDDYAQIAAVESRHGLTMKSRDEWLALWLNNPAYLKLGDWPIGWVIEDGDNRIVGSLGNVPTFVYFGGNQYVSAAGRGWAVDVQFRALSVMLLARQLRQKGADMNVIATPSPITAALCSQLGWSKVPVGKWNRSQFWIANHSRVVRGYLGARFPQFIAQAAGALLAPPLQWRDSLARPQSPRSDYRLEWFGCFDERFDRMWMELEQQHPGLLLGARDSETLGWHFKRSLEQNCIWILTASRGPNLVGYAVFERRKVQTLDLERALLIDFQTIVTDPALSQGMIDHALARCRLEGVHILENMGCWLEELQPISRHPYRRTLESWCYLYRIANSKLDRALQSADAWYPTQYDGDASL
jgi:hypothetical protein